MKKNELVQYRDQALFHLNHELLPFWTDRMIDKKYGGFITHFDEQGNDTGEDEKSLIAQTRCLFTISSAIRAGYDTGNYLKLAKHGADFIINKMWDEEHGGFYWMVDRKGNIKIDQKIVYGLSFAIYALSEYTLATKDPRGLEYAEKVFDLIQKYCVDSYHGGYYEMFSRNWILAGPGSAGGDRKTLDVHMHLMEAFTTLYEATQKNVHRRKLLEDIEILLNRMMDQKYKTGIPQFWSNWEIAPQIKFDIIWGWDRYSDDGSKNNAIDNTCYGHNAEFAWLFIHALNILGNSNDAYINLLKTIFDHSVDNGVDNEYGGVYVEGPHSGGVSDKEKEFWQQAEVMIGVLDAAILFDDPKYWNAYKNIHSFVFEKVINKGVGEWYPLLSRKGEPIWRHMSHSWKVNYHSVRAIIQSVNRLNILIEKK